MWSIGNHMAAEEVINLVDSHFEKNYGPEVERQFSRDQALAIVHSAIWGVAVRSGSTAGAYAFMALMNAIGIISWTFDQEEADALQRFRREKSEAQRAIRLAEAIAPEQCSAIATSEP